MVRRHPVLEVCQPGVVTENAEVAVAEVRGAGRRHRPDLLPLVRGGEPHPVGDDLTRRRLAPIPGEDEVDGGEHPLLGEELDRLGAAGCPEPPAVTLGE